MPSQEEQSTDLHVTTHPTRRRKRSGNTRQTQQSIYSDEHPEIPKIRRASLPLHEQQPSSLPDQRPKRRRRVSSTQQLASRRTTPRIRQTRQSQQLTRKDLPASHTHEDIASPYRKRPFRQTARQAEDAAPATSRKPSLRSVKPHDERVTSHTTKEELAEPEADILLTPKRTRKLPATEPEPEPERTIIRSRPTKQRPRSHVQEVGTRKSIPSNRQRKQQPSILLTSLQALRHNRPLMLIFLAGILILILLPTLTHLITGASSTIISLGNPRVSTGNGLVPSNSHEVIITAPSTDHPAPPVFATSAYVLDANTGATLYAHNPFEHLPMLSTTKLMTMLIAAEKGNPDQKITINDQINHDIQQLSADSSLMGIKKGETYTLRDLLYGSMLVSGNDAATAIADTIGGSLPNFVQMMNQRAQELGLFDTHYMNPHGLMEPGHYSCAHDLAVLGKYSLSNPLLHQISGTREDRITKSNTHDEHDMINGNQFLWWYPGADGGKPGWDGDKNFIQVASVTRNNRHLIGVTMHTNDWWTDMRSLMNWGLNSFTWVSPYDVDFQHPIPYDSDWGFFARDQKENTIPTGDGGRYYIFTSYSVSGPILAYFDKNNGLKKFGFPRGMPHMLNDTTISQLFDHGTIQCDTQTKACKTA